MAMPRIEGNLQGLMPHRLLSPITSLRTQCFSLPSALGGVNEADTHPPQAKRIIFTAVPLSTCTFARQAGSQTRPETMLGDPL